jgi:hypothetical protein
MTESKNVTWRKSTYSDGTGNCVEVGSGDHSIAVRDTKQGRRSPSLTFTEAAWRRFLAETKNDRPDL